MIAAFQNSFFGKTVLVTGHTGFKGSWLCEWLLALGAHVHGYALDPITDQDLFLQLNLNDRIKQDIRANVSDSAKLNSLVSELKPDFIFHLAAQPLVRLSYEIPVETFATNVIGTVNLLEAIRRSGHPCAVVVVTTDKCYQNKEWNYSYREEDPLGGHDPYSASKAAAELVVSSYRSSFFPTDGAVKLASARAGNVIGGGDWAADRIVPDCIRAIREGLPIKVRNKISTRPWQHVLEPLSGYLWLAARLAEPNSCHTTLCSSFNFGPSIHSNRTVSDLVQRLTAYMGGEWVDAADPCATHEAGKLNLSIDKAFHLLGWSPIWNFEKTIQHTATWYQQNLDSQSSVQDYTQQQIQDYVATAHALEIPWAMS